MCIELNYKRILFGITGGISAYKCYELVRLAQETKAEIKVVLTQSAEAFVSTLCLQTISRNQLYLGTALHLKEESTIEHIDLARWADIVCIAPATANFIAKVAHGIADDLLSTICLATVAPIAIAPAMNQQMWHNAATQANVELLKMRHFNILGPNFGPQVCGDHGLGRMLEPKVVLESLSEHFTKKKLKNKNILITAGPTHESIDPVRYIGNRSSGKMGYAIANAAHRLGAKVTLISGPTALPIPKDVNTIMVSTAQSMFETVMTEVDGTDIFVSCAAVSDYSPITFSKQKLKKTDVNLTLYLKRNPDILVTVANLPTPPFTIGFSAETESHCNNAIKKLKEKNLDMVVVNSVFNSQVFESNYNTVQIFRRGARPISFPRALKTILAKKILMLALETYEHKKMLDNC